MKCMLPLLILLSYSVASASDLDSVVVRTGIGWSEESSAIFGQMTSRSNPVALLDLGYHRKRLGLGVQLSARFGSKALTSTTGAFVGELDTFRGGFSVEYRIKDDLKIEFVHWSDHSLPVALGQGTFSDLSQRNVVILWKEWK